MPNLRLMLWGVLAAVLFLNYQTWLHDYAPAVASTTQSPATGASPAASAPANAGTLADTVPQASTSTTAPVPIAQTTNTAAAGSPAPLSSIPATPDAGSGTSSIAPLHVVTDVLDIAINLKGGELERADLKAYPLRKDTPNIPVRLLSREPPPTLYLLQSGLTGTPGEAAPTHLAAWKSAQTEYLLAPNAAELRVPLTWTDGKGLSVTKTFTFKRGQYAIGLDYDVKNDSGEPRKLASYAQFLRHWEHASRSYFDVETYSFKGPAVYDGTKSKDLNVESDTDSKYSSSITNGWMASLQHQFVAAIIPPAGQPYQYQLQVRDHEYLISATGPVVDVPTGATVQFHEELFVGPKLQSQLAAMGRNLERTVDFGVLTVLAQPLFTGLNWVHKLTGNWGWSIILVTALIKLLFYPLSQASGRSMAKMRAVGPRMKQIQETFKDDREKLGRAMMELYKKEKINPLAGCLPMVIQIPVFISFYRVLLESVEMRQAPFLLWINDLSSRDPYFVLPLLMGAAMFAQFKLNPQAADPMQARIMQFMPLIMTGMMAFFPSGLTLYWLTNTVLSIAQQWRVNKVVEAEAAKQRS
ncbi:MAG TPA: membrane protein insertase YidC [Steroidobacteraceae bacterium]|jgi:YidC/Oxa1 family membrane protein insertase|nr:membrane protein insertase YidC [Steroidobacteraceae bacterium]